MPLKALYAPRQSACILALLAALATCVVVRPHDADAAPALPGEPCQVEPRPTWSETEKWVWSEVCVGEIADLNLHFYRGLEPRSADGWTDGRKLSSVFLETVLLYDPWRSAIPHQGVRIVGAWFDEPIDLVEAEISQEIWLDHSRFTSDVDLSKVRTKFRLTLEDSVLTGSLNMYQAQIGGELDMTGAKVTGALNMDSAKIGGYLSMSDGAEFKEVSLINAQVGSTLNLGGAKVTGVLNMDSANIDGWLLMRNGAEFANVILTAAHVGGTLDLGGAKVTGALNMDSAKVGGHLLMRNGAEFANVICSARTSGVSLASTAPRSLAHLTWIRRPSAAICSCALGSTPNPSTWSLPRLEAIWTCGAPRWQGST